MVVKLITMYCFRRLLEHSMFGVIEGDDAWTYIGAQGPQYALLVLACFLGSRTTAYSREVVLSLHVYQHPCISDVPAFHGVFFCADLVISLSWSSSVH